jgi:hypothetical protein
MRKRILIALIAGLILSMAWGGLLGYLNGTPPPRAWPPSAALVSWPAGSWVVLFIPSAVFFSACLLMALRRPGGSGRCSQDRSTDDASRHAGS